jgi:hypothetical protein
LEGGVIVARGFVNVGGGSSSSTTITEQTGASYTLALADANTWIEMNSASAQTVTVPPNSSVAFPVGTEIILVQKGAGQTTISAGAGVTVSSYGSEDKIYGQYAVVGLKKVATDTWYLFGNLTA